MAFTPQEKARILYYLGYSMFEDDGPAQRAINALDSKEPVAGSIVRDLMDKIQRITNDEEQVRVLSKATKIGADEVRAHYTLDVLRSLGREHVNRLATFCKISVCSDIFSPGGAAREPASFFSGDPSEKRINPTVGMPTTGSFGPNPMKIR